MTLLLFILNPVFLSTPDNIQARHPGTSMNFLSSRWIALIAKNFTIEELSYHGCREDNSFILPDFNYGAEARKLWPLHWDVRSLHTVFWSQFSMYIRGQLATFQHDEKKIKLWSCSFSFHSKSRSLTSQSIESTVLLPRKMRLLSSQEDMSPGEVVEFKKELIQG